MSQGPFPRSGPRAWLVVASASFLTACGGAPSPSGPTPTADLTEAEWRAFAAPRPEPLDGAARVTVGEIRLTGSAPWIESAPLPASLGLQELVSAGLLRRRDVRFVERRRFSVAADRERRGLPRPDAAPPVGVSPGAELSLSGTWATFGMASAYLEMRLIDVQSGEVVATWRSATATDADPIALSRTIVSGLLSALDELGRRPAWTDPIAAAAPEAYQPTPVPAAAVDAFFRGLAAEELWNWAGAAAGYREAAAVDGFFEAEVALARAARLRLGGTLAES